MRHRHRPARLRQARRRQQISLALIKLGATDPAHRIGTLFTNPGGPGNSGVAFVRDEARDVYSAGVRARFDVVGFDPRGVGESTPVRCPAGEPQPPFPVGAQQEREFAAAAADLGRRCRVANGELLDHLSTANVARDLDVLRAAVGDAKLTFAGHSYGSHLGATYANLFPQRVRAIVLDSVLDSNAWMNGIGPFSLRVGSQEATSKALRYFLETCKAAGPKCAFSDGDPVKEFDTLMARLREAPLSGFTYADVVNIMRDVLGFTPGWPSTAEALAGLRDGTFLAKQAAPEDDDSAAKLAIACGETDNPRLPLLWPLAARIADHFTPYFGASWTYISQACATWPGHDDDRYTGPVQPQDRRAAAAGQQPLRRRFVLRARPARRAHPRRRAPADRRGRGPHPGHDRQPVRRPRDRALPGLRRGAGPGRGLRRPAESVRLTAGTPVR